MGDRQKRRIVGILDVLSGVAGLTSAFVVLILEYYVALAAVLGLFGILSLAGGLSAFIGKRWNLVLAGSICAVLASPLFGIPALVFALLPKKD